MMYVCMNLHARHSGKQVGGGQMGRWAGGEAGKRTMGNGQVGRRAGGQASRWAGGQVGGGDGQAGDQVSRYSNQSPKNCRLDAQLPCDTGNRAGGQAGKWGNGQAGRYFDPLHTKCSLV